LSLPCVASTNYGMFHKKIAIWVGLAHSSHYLFKEAIAKLWCLVR
jgi:hypothetical protein